MTIISVTLSYLIGSIPTGYILYKFSEKNDIRRFGSQATGATNVLRLKGWKYAIPVGLFDILKGFFVIYFALKLFPDKRIALLLCGFFVVLGHCFPIFIKFRGGKGVATAMGIYAALAPIPLLCSMAIFLAVVLLTKYVSMGSLLAMISYPIFVLFFKAEQDVIYLSFAIFCLIISRHMGNIKRLIVGNERKFGEKAT
jgi:glycerol-3-phosphate acyltransferase PlsY